MIDRLIETFEPDRGHLIAVPVSEGRRGNPVLWSRRFFRELMTLDGDVGARHLIAKHAEAVAEVPVEGESAFLDIDTPQALEAARRAADSAPPVDADFQPSVHQVETSPRYNSLPRIASGEGILIVSTAPPSAARCSFLR